MITRTYDQSLLTSAQVQFEASAPVAANTTAYTGVPKQSLGLKDIISRIIIRNATAAVTEKTIICFFSEESSLRMIFSCFELGCLQ